MRKQTARADRRPIARLYCRELTWYNLFGCDSNTHDDGFHEIQLNGKQLVFLFMAATVVSVVIFLCGVLVGRGVRAERTLLADAAACQRRRRNANATAAASTRASAGVDSGPVPIRGLPRRRRRVDELSYFNRLETKTPPREQLKPATDEACGGQAGRRQAGQGDRPRTKIARRENTHP